MWSHLFKNYIGHTPCIKTCMKFAWFGCQWEIHGPLTPIDACHAIFWIQQDPNHWATYTYCRCTQTFGELYQGVPKQSHSWLHDIQRVDNTLTDQPESILKLSLTEVRKSLRLCLLAKFTGSSLQRKDCVSLKQLGLASSLSNGLLANSCTELIQSPWIETMSTTWGGWLLASGIKGFKRPVSSNPLTPECPATEQKNAAAATLIVIHLLLSIVFARMHSGTDYLLFSRSLRTTMTYNAQLQSIWINARCNHDVWQCNKSIGGQIRRRILMHITHG